MGGLKYAPIGCCSCKNQNTNIGLLEVDESVTSALERYIGYDAVESSVECTVLGFDRVHSLAAHVNRTRSEWPGRSGHMTICMSGTTK